MTDSLTAFGAQIQASLKAAQDRLERLNAAAKEGAGVAEKEIRLQLAHLEAHTQKAEGMFAKARSDFTAWTDESLATVAAWKAKFDTAQLTARADRAKRHAEAATELAIAAIAGAEKAALDVKLADEEAKAAKVA